MPAAPLRAPAAAPSAGRGDSLRWLFGSLCAGLGAIILVAPHRFSAPLFAAATGLRDSWGAAALLSGVALLAVAVLQPSAATRLAAHLFAAATLLALAAAFATSGIWIGTAAYLLFGVFTLLGGLPWAERREGRPRDLFAAVMSLVCVTNGAALLMVPAASRAAYFGPARAVLPLLAAVMLTSGLALAAVELTPDVGRRFEVFAHLLAGAAFLGFGLLVSARQQAWTALVVNLVYGGALACLPWSAPLLGRLRASPLWARFAFVLATSNALALILTTALATHHVERLVLAHVPPDPALRGVAEAVLAADVRRGRDVALIVLLALVPAAIASGILLARRVGRPLAGLTAAVDEMTAGKPFVPVVTGDITEVARLASAFATLNERLAERSAESARLAAELVARAQALEELDRRKNEFLGMLGHELRNPIGAIANAAYLLQQLAPSEPNLRRASELILRQVNHLIRLLEDLLDVSRITRGKLTLRPAPLDLRVVVEHAIETTRAILEAKGQELRVALPAEPLSFVGDADRLEQVLCNLLRNASAYTPEGGTIEVEARADGGTAWVRVRDDGMGISADLLPRIFEAFQQGPRGLEHGGLGIGLTLVKSLVELHGGDVMARSDGAGRGSELVVRLPLVPPVTAADLSAPAWPVAPPGS